MASNYRGNLNFDREQLVFMVDTILIGALDRIESGLPTSSVSYKERKEQLHPSPPASMSWYERGALEAAGMSLGVLYAQLTDDGLGIGDALHCADKFDEACENLVHDTWIDEGKAVIDAEKARLGTQYTVEEVYANYPDTRKHAESFVDKVFSDYLAKFAEKPTLSDLLRDKMDALEKTTNLPTFEVTLAGFNIETTDTDEKVWWFKAPDIRALEIFLMTNMTDPEGLDECPRHLTGRDEQISPEECDIILDANGNVLKANREWKGN